uniref:glutamate 5-kinase n=1 Tax=Ningiella ruwaisensis TaxID=2364274 RepID=UPI0010A0A776|nr:glutamate 5-kinase [Ningiella ruwaisensis]
MTAFSWQTAVIKIGSALVSPDGEGTSEKFLGNIANFIIECRKQNKDVILVSSGSVAAARGVIKIGVKVSPEKKTAMAAIGQTKMMATWANLFDFPCAQLLLTVEDLNDRKRFVNIKNTIQQLLVHGALPIVNENDTVALDTSKVGDNDNLAAHTAIAAQADCLIICTDVDGLYTGNPRLDPEAKLLPTVDHIDEGIMGLAGGAGSAVGTGGMITKLQAAQKCAGSGIQTLLVNGEKESTFKELIKGNCPGTLFLAYDEDSTARQDWLKHTSHPKGELVVDKGAYLAVTERGASLLAAGITQVIGKFNEGDAVLVTHEGKVIGKGLAAYSSSEIQQIKGAKSAQIQYILGYSESAEVLHRDDFVLLHHDRDTADDHNQPLPDDTHTYD